ncbi:MAG: peptidyl-prolyl cis-trans isomerase, partial [Isosphaeraceae bacterium]
KPGQARTDRSDPPVGIKSLPPLHTMINGPSKAEGRTPATGERPATPIAARIIPAPPATPLGSPSTPSAPTDPAVSTAENALSPPELPPLETDAAQGGPAEEPGPATLSESSGASGDPAQTAEAPAIVDDAADPAPEAQASPAQDDPASFDAPPPGLPALPPLPETDADPLPAANGSAIPALEAPPVAEAEPLDDSQIPTLEAPPAVEAEPLGDLPAPPELLPLDAVEPPKDSPGPANSAPPLLEPVPSTSAEPPANAPSADIPPDDAVTPTAFLGDAPRDPGVQMASAIEMHSDMTATPGKLLGLNVARVGDRMITWNELKRSIRDFRRQQGIDDRPLSEPEEQQIAKIVLDKLINRTLILEEARRSFKKPEQWKKLQEMADESWDKTELPPLLKKYKVNNKYELDVILTKQGESLEHYREANRMEAISSEFLMMKLRSRFKPSLSEMRTYYQNNTSKFDLPAQISWREVVIRLDGQTDRAGVRRSAEAALDRLRRNEDFAKVAKAVSQGATADQGGFWETEPGTHAAPAVNTALGSLPIRQVSPILECPDALRILRVESRRAAGPAPFSEVQAKISHILFERNAEQEITTFIKKLRGESLVRYMIKFDVPDHPIAGR